ncbi:hypothetical protein D081_1074 [Anaerovibrio sp. JC8]|uniref:DUF2971 domain-containing protein n=1 Tax=Anaerovibrio sp. JC8 TaxID=1240085 RepID=UPI000A0ADDB5|nr:DUF2971 domain-containing protein [Anaerovibrio sp. JC8]ORU00551.1 hypothetical protein D081_1074 [Anaerovibrio sp. JC8]
MTEKYTYTELEEDLEKIINETGIFYENVDNMFHYTTLKGMMGIIDSASMHLSRIDVLNDEKEVKYLHNEFSKALDYCIKQVTLEKDGHFLNVFKDIVDNNKRELSTPTTPWGRNPVDSYLHSNEVYVCSFSTKEDSLDMWKYYSKGDGVCIKFNIDKCAGYYDKIYEYRKAHDSIVAVRCNKYIGKVIYDADQQVKLFEEILMKGLETYKKFCGDDDNKVLDMFWGNEFYKRVIFPMALFMKDPSFSNEQESRIVITKKFTMSEKSDWDTLAFVGEYSNRYKLIDGMLRPYIEMAIPQDSICKIHLSPTTKCDGKVVLEYLKSKGIKIEESNIVKSKIPLRF